MHAHMHKHTQDQKKKKKKIGRDWYMAIKKKKITDRIKGIAAYLTKML